MAAVIAALLAACAVCPAAEGPRQTTEQWVPDALVLVMTGLGPGERVSIAYPGEVSEKQANEDLAKVALVSGWFLQNGRTVTSPSGAPDGKRATSSSFETTGIIDQQAGTLRLEPFLVALKRFARIEVIYVNVPDMEFVGLKDFEDRFVKITMSRQDSSYRYRARVKDASFEKLDLPLTAVSAADEKRGGGGMNPLFRAAVIVILAVAAAAAMYAAAVRLARRSRA